ncbi:MAG: DeoR family transcriptional regulator [Bacteroidales bacterium]|nr:DeoR family transcriptional regulator [Bacteroidales bacterium]
MQIIKQIRQNTYITREGLIEKTKLSDSTIARGLKSLQIKGLIKRTGAKKNGHWEIIEQSNK